MRFVAATTSTPSTRSTPSISFNNAASNRCWTPPLLSPVVLRAATNASISSKNTTAGAVRRAWSNICRIVRSASPTKDDITWAGVAVMKVAADAVATALTSVVLLQPGGPCNNIPRRAGMPSVLNIAGYRNGHSIYRWSRFFTDARPPISLHLVCGTSVDHNDRCEAGRTDRRAA